MGEQTLEVGSVIAGPDGAAASGGSAQEDRHVGGLARVVGHVLELEQPLHLNLDPGLLAHLPTDRFGGRLVDLLVAGGQSPLVLEGRDRPPHQEDPPVAIQDHRGRGTGRAQVKDEATGRTGAAWTPPTSRSARGALHSGQ